MKILFLTSGSGKILNLIFKRSRVLSKNLFLVILKSHAMKLLKKTKFRFWTF